MKASLTARTALQTSQHGFCLVYDLQLSNQYYVEIVDVDCIVEAKYNWSIKLIDYHFTVVNKIYK